MTWPKARGACERCGREGIIYRTGAGWLCARCTEARRPRRPCAGCGEDKRICARRPEGEFCQSCWSRRRPTEVCAECGRSRRAASRLEDGQALCVSCWQRRQPHERCGGCGRMMRVAAHSPTGEPRCAACQRTASLRPCHGCGERFPKLTALDGQGLCRECHAQAMTDLNCPACGGPGPLLTTTDGEQWCHPCWRRRAGDGCASCSGPGGVIIDVERLEIVCTDCWKTSSRVVACGTCGQTGRWKAELVDGFPQCVRCWRTTPRPCARCGGEALSTRRWPEGPVCSTCVRAVALTQEPCSGCGRLAPVLARNEDGGARCPACSGVAFGASCTRCGGPRPRGGALCPSCRRDDAVAGLFVDSPGDDSHERFRLALLQAPNAASLLAWLRVSPVRQALADLAAGRNALTHETLDALGRDKSILHLRQLLVSAGALPERDERLAALEVWADNFLAGVHPDDVGLLRPYARWNVVGRARQRAEREPLSKGGQAHATNQLRAGSRFLRWLDNEGLTFATLRQGDLDRFLLGQTAYVRRCVDAFLTWSARNGHCPKHLEIPKPSDAMRRTALPDQERWAIVRRLFDDETLALSDRVAGCLVLIYGQILTRVVKLTADHVNLDEDQLSIRLGAEPLVVIEPMATLVARLKEEVDRRRATTQPRWLFPGERPGSAITAPRLGTRLRRLGVPNASHGRNAALLNLAGSVPAPILARMLGISNGCAEQWFCLAGGDRGRYVALRDDDELKPGATAQRPPPESEERPGADAVRPEPG